MFINDQFLIDISLCFQKPTDELGKEYVGFVSGNLDMVRQKTCDEIFVNTLFEVRKQILLGFSYCEIAKKVEQCSYQLHCLLRKCIYSSYVIHFTSLVGFTL